MIVEIKASELLEKALGLAAGGYRLVQVCCTKVGDDLEILYSFDKDYELMNLKLTIPDGLEVMSITSAFWPAFIYENEISDLFGIAFKNSELDYGGHFFKVSETTPWNPKKQEGGAE